MQELHYVSSDSLSAWMDFVKNAYAVTLWHKLVTLYIGLKRIIKAVIISFMEIENP